MNNVYSSANTFKILMLNIHIASLFLGVKVFMILFPAGIDGSNMFPTLWFELFFEFTDLKLVEIIIILRRLLEEIAGEISIYAVRSILLLLSSNQGC